MKRAAFVLFAVLATFVPANVFAGPMLTLSSPDDLTNLSILDVVTIKVELSGLAGIELILLATDIELPAGIFGGTTVPIPGAIVPNNPTFDGFADPVFAAYTDPNFLDPFAPSIPIQSDGLFFSFTTTVVGAGTGDISISSAFALDSFFDEVPLELGNPLPVFVSSGNIGGDVPEPGAAAVWSLLAGMALIVRRRQSNPALSA